MATLDGTGSSDPDGDPLTYMWAGPFEGSPVHGANPTVQLVPGCCGSYEITLVVNDGHLDSASDTVQITVQDTTPPSIMCPGSIVLRTQNANGVPASDPAIVTFLNGASASDNCDPAPVINHDAPGDSFPLGETLVTFTATDASSNAAQCQAAVTVLLAVEDFYLRGTAPDLILDSVAPTGTTPEYVDSPGLRRAEFQEVGTWTCEVPSGASLRFDSTADLRVWVGLKNSDDQGTYFDLLAELLKNGTPVASCEALDIRGVTRNPARAKEVVLDFGVLPGIEFDAGDDLSVRVLAKVTAVGGHSNAVGLRLYYDAVTRPSRFKASSSQ